MEKLLLIVDNEDILKVIELCLIDRKIEILKAYKREEAFQYLINNDIDFVIINNNLADINGYQWIYEFEHHEVIKNITVILLLDTFAELDRKELEGNIHIDYIIKPFTSEELLFKFNRLIESKLCVQEGKSTMDTDKLQSNEDIELQDIELELPVSDQGDITLDEISPDDERVLEKMPHEPQKELNKTDGGINVIGDIGEISLDNGEISLDPGEVDLSLEESKLMRSQ